MDLICLILWIIDLFKPSISLSIAVIVTGVIDLLLLCHQKKKNESGLCSKYCWCNYRNL